MTEKLPLRPRYAGRYAVVGKVNGQVLERSYFLRRTAVKTAVAWARAEGGRMRPPAGHKDDCGCPVCAKIRPRVEVWKLSSVGVPEHLAWSNA